MTSQQARILPALAEYLLDETLDKLTDTELVVERIEEGVISMQLRRVIDHAPLAEIARCPLRVGDTLTCSCTTTS